LLAELSNATKTLAPPEAEIAGPHPPPAAPSHPRWSLPMMMRFLELFLEGQEVGIALREARRYLLEEMGNPLGLFYVHFGPATQQLIRLDGDGIAEESMD